MSELMTGSKPGISGIAHKTRLTVFCWIGLPFLTLLMFGFYLFAVNVMGLSASQSLTLIIPTSAALFACCVALLQLLRNIVYAPALYQKQKELAEKSAASKIFIRGIIAIILLSAGFMYSLTYIAERDDVIVGVVLAIVGIIGTIMLIPVARYIYLRLGKLSFID